MKHEEGRPGRSELLRGAEAIGVGLSDEAVDRLLLYEGLLLERAVPLGFVAASDAARLLERHILDSLRAAAVVEEGDRTALDLGSGAGLPGIVVGIARPNLLLRLAESQRRRVAFLELVVERLGLSGVEAVPGRLEDLPGEGSADLAFARALGPPERSWSLAAPLLHAGGRLVYFAGSASEPDLSVPGTSRVERREFPALESSGSLVIMTR